MNGQLCRYSHTLCIRRRGRYERVRNFVGMATARWAAAEGPPRAASTRTPPARGGRALVCCAPARVCVPHCTSGHNNSNIGPFDLFVYARPLAEHARARLSDEWTNLRIPIT
ncbi:hypothetical protein EVAR_35202_1 [Eumeta japonica]|uniref:Uncharacterized protein n=1 Tax=Eumeta variegata TaxID=151549 RepID=A0A4C1VDD6_EUMVA|nr:hypothetical protein EVAR_35202_1 [Eumeta japonica]